MKRLLAFALLAVSAVAVAPASAAPCRGPVATNCTQVDENGEEVVCDVYVETPEPVVATSCVSVEE